MYKDSKVNMARKKHNKQDISKDIIEQILYLEDSLPIFKNLMGENVSLQNTLYFKQAQSMMDGEYYSKVSQIDEHIKREGQQDFTTEGNNKTKTSIVATDLSKDIQAYAVQIAVRAINNLKPQLKDVNEKANSLIEYVKKEFENKYNSNWAIVVGTNFNSFITNKTTQYIHLLVDKIAFLIIREVPRGANDNYYRLYLTKKSLESFHDYVYSYRLKQ